MSQSADLRNSHFYCPITEEVMSDPVIDPEGNSYERKAITSWLSHNNTSPITRTHLTIDQLIPNRSLRKAIEDEHAMLRDAAAASSIEFTEKLLAATTRGGGEQEKPALSLSYKLGKTPNTFELLASITPPVDVSNDVRSGCDICCVVDVSGSMGGDASIVGAENSGLSLLDITKHALKTVISSLKAVDRLSLVSYSNTAKVVCGLTPMTAAGKARAMDLVDTLQADGMTNLWDGLKKGLDTLTEASTAGSIAGGVRNAAVFILTDGEPNVEPPRGHIPMLQRYREKNQGRFPGTISTFGFGYAVKSLLLRDIAQVGGGMYAFIPDSGFVGTAFVNALANQLATMGMHATLSVELPSELQASLAQIEGHEGGAGRGILGQSADVAMVTSWGASVDVGNVKFGQRKDVVFRLTLPEGVESVESVVAAGDFLASFSYTPLRQENPSPSAPSGEVVITTTTVLPPDNQTTSYCEVQTFRCETIMVIADLMEQKLANPQVVLNTTALTNLIGTMREWVSNHPENDQKKHCALVSGLMRDLSGQITEAVKDQYFKKWGRHFLPSLARAHQLQECLNFKDPGVQLYGGNLFQTERDFADDAFNSLPAPTPAPRSYSSYRGGGGGSRSSSSSTSNYSAPVSMSCFNSASAPCFHGDCLVHMSDGSVKAVSDVRRGDKVLCNTHQNHKQKNFINSFAEVECVVQTQTRTGVLDLMHFSGGLRVTPYHPIYYLSSSQPSWHFPMDLIHKGGKLLATECSAVYSFLLGPSVDAHTHSDTEKIVEKDSGRAQSMTINGIPCITLAHGITGDEVAAHEFYGTERVVASLRDVSLFHSQCRDKSNSGEEERKYSDNDEGADAKGGERQWEGGRVVLVEGCVIKDPISGQACGFLPQPLPMPLSIVDPSINE